MRDLVDLVRFDLEGASVDFKAVQYTRERHEDLLKDVLSMANADVDGDRFIVLGVKLRPDGSRQFRGIPKEEFRDAAEYQQLILQNIEPELGIDYLPVEVDDVLIGVLRIHDCNDPPYLMRKQYGGLQHGEGFVRKGTHQPRLARRDFERFLKERSYRDDLVNQIRLSFLSGEIATEATLRAPGELSFPSDEAAERIKAILAERRSLEAGGGHLGWRVAQSLSFSASVFGGPTPFEQRSNETLEKDLEALKETYREHDLHYGFETCANHLQLYVYNAGQYYAEDASIKLRFPPIDGLLVADRIYRKPRPSSGPLASIQPYLDPDVTIPYPHVQETADGTVVTERIGDIRHGLWTPAFGKKLRVVLRSDLVGTRFPISYQVFSKNLPKAVAGKLHVQVVGSDLDDVGDGAHAV